MARKKTVHHPKLKSTKLWITLWAIALITFIVLADRVDYYGIAQLLCSIPLSYVVANVAQKAIYKQDEETQTER